MPVAAESLERNFGRSRLRAAQFAGVFAHPERISREMLWELGSYAVRAPATLQAAYELAGYDTRDRLSEISLPTLLIWGNNDLLVPVAAAFSYQKRISQAELALLDDTGHMIQMERPGRFNHDVEEFVDCHRATGDAEPPGDAWGTPTGDEQAARPRPSGRESGSVDSGWKRVDGPGPIRLRDRPAS